MAPTFRVTSQAKAKVHARFASALHHLDDLGRDPGWREEECLFHALGYMKRGNYKLADAELKQLTGLFAAPSIVRLLRRSRASDIPWPC